MRGENVPPVKIDPKEAASLFRFARLEEMRRSEALLVEFRRTIEPQAIEAAGQDSLWLTLSLLSFVYGTGRVQGIREERARKRYQHH